MNDKLKLAWKMLWSHTLRALACQGGSSLEYYDDCIRFVGLWFDDLSVDPRAGIRSLQLSGSISSLPIKSSVRPTGRRVCKSSVVMRTGTGSWVVRSLEIDISINNKSITKWCLWLFWWFVCRSGTRSLQFSEYSSSPSVESSVWAAAETEHGVISSKSWFW